MENTFTIILNDAKPDSWPDIVWTDAKIAGACVLLDNSIHMKSWQKRLRVFHFSNIANSSIWLPAKCFWDWSNVLRLEDLDPNKRNYVIFQTGIKFSAHYIHRMKREKNVCIILYMPDNIHTIGIAKNKEEFYRFCRHYGVDQVYSFDKKDCKLFGAKFFDFYSMLPCPIKKDFTDTDLRKKILYVGNCRNKERLDILHRLYERLNTELHCIFYINGVAETDKKYQDIFYNHPLTYRSVVSLIQQSDAILEIINGRQAGNTLRFKEAVCYDKLLLTNNQNCQSDKYFSPQYMQVFTDIENIDIPFFNKQAAYNYCGEYSPYRLMELIVANDTH